MRFIKSNWQGFEIDSSEYSALLSLSNPTKQIRNMLNSPKIVSYFCSKSVVENILSAVAILKSEHDDTQIHEAMNKILEEVSPYIEKDLTKEIIIRLVEISNSIVESYPHLTFEFLTSTIDFRGLVDAPMYDDTPELEMSYTLSVVGLPIVHSFNMAYPTPSFGEFW